MTALKEENLVVPSVANIRKRLAAATAQSRFLRRLLRLAIEAENSQRLETAAKEGKQ